MQTYNSDTGQVYVETTVPAHSMVTSCMNHFSGRRKDPKSHTNHRGAARLCDMALRTCAWNIYDPGIPVTLPYFSDEFEIMRHIYLHLKETDTLTFKAWKIFLDAFPGKFQDNHRVSILKQYGGLDQIDTICRHISSISATALTFLCIQNLTLSLVNMNSDLLRFSNLGVLVLQTATRSPLDDRMIKNWGHSVRQIKAFQKLTVLTLANIDIRIDDALDALANFPALKLCRLESILFPSWLNDARNEGSAGIHPKGTWRQRLPNGDHESMRDPETVFGRIDLTTHTKMELLYDISAWEVEVARTHLPTVSIHYGNTALLSGLTHSTWFVKITPQAKDMPSPKRALENKMEGPTAKKRKMRNGKGMDLVSMLGSFTR